jgi:transcription-repair coupling factor (superfamily II helicase)
MSPSDLRRSILETAKKDPVFLKIADEIAVPSDKHINITGMTDSQKAYIAASLAANAGTKPVVLVPDELRARTVQQDLSAFLDGEVLILRPRELNLADVDASSREAELSRIGVLMRLLSGDFGGAVITAGALTNRLMPDAAFRSSVVYLKLGMRVSPRTLPAAHQYRLTSGHEKSEARANSTRGDIFDVIRSVRTNGPPLLL